MLTDNSIQTKSYAWDLLSLRKCNPQVKIAMDRPCALICKSKTLPLPVIFQRKRISTQYCLKLVTLNDMWLYAGNAWFHELRKTLRRKVSLKFSFNDYVIIHQSDRIFTTEVFHSFANVVFWFSKLKSQPWKFWM